MPVPKTGVLPLHHGTIIITLFAKSSANVILFFFAQTKIVKFSDIIRGELLKLTIFVPNIILQKNIKTKIHTR